MKFTRATNCETIGGLEPKYHPALLIRINNSTDSINISRMLKGDWDAVLVTTFDDIDTDRYGGILFGERHAVEIIQRVSERKWKEITVHCGAGVSRSPAVVLFLLEWLGIKRQARRWAKKYPNYNRKVYSVLTNMRMTGKESPYDEDDSASS